VAGPPFQNGIAERPNQTMATIVHCLLHSAQLGPEYWSYALLHAAYLKNKLPHIAIHTTPYQAYTGQRPLQNTYASSAAQLSPRMQENDQQNWTPTQAQESF
jgi:hypothetical protein